jgi:predicted nuclease with TOPRIM domain
LTTLKVKIDELHERRITIITKVTLGEAEKQKIIQRIKTLDEELDAKVGSFKSFEHTQTQQIEKLRLFREAMNNINKDILELKADLSSIRARREA